MFHQQILVMLNMDVMLMVQILLQGLFPLHIVKRYLLSQSPAVNISANVIGTGSVGFTMSIQDVNETTSTKTCTVTATGSGNIGCIPSNFSISGGDYFVCIKTTNSAK